MTDGARSPAITAMDRENSSLVEHTLFGTEDFVDKAVRELRYIAQKNRICLRFSGGKDSVAIKHLLDIAGVPYDAKFSLTSVDPPELLQFVKKEHPDVEPIKPPTTMFQLIIKKGSLRLGYAGIAAKNLRSEMSAAEAAIS